MLRWELLVVKFKQSRLVDFSTLSTQKIYRERQDRGQTRDTQKKKPKINLSCKCSSNVVADWGRKMTRNTADFLYFRHEYPEYQVSFLTSVLLFFNIHLQNRELHCRNNTVTLCFCLMSGSWVPGGPRYIAISTPWPYILPPWLELTTLTCPCFSVTQNQHQKACCPKSLFIVPCIK